MNGTGRKAKAVVHEHQRLSDAKTSVNAGVIMSNTAEILNFPAPVAEIQEQRVADLEDGFTRIANELLEAVMLAGLSQHQLLVFMAVMRKTYGFNKKSDWVSNEQLSSLTGILPHKCSAAKSVLVKRGIFTQTGRSVGINNTVSEWSVLPESGKKNRVYLKEAILPESGKKSLPESGNGTYPNKVNTKDTITKNNKNIKNKPPVVPRTEDSARPEKPQKRVTQFPEDFVPTDGNRKLAAEPGVDLQSEISAFSDHHRSKGSTFRDWNSSISQAGKSLAKPANKTLAESANTDKPTQLNTKETIQKKERKDPPKSPRGKPRFNPFSVELPEWLNPDAWHEWVSYRLQSGRPIKTGMTVTKAFNLLKQYLDEGCDPVDVINSSIANGYQGLFRPKYAPCKPVSAGKEQAGSHWNDRREWEENFI